MELGSAKQEVMSNTPLIGAKRKTFIVKRQKQGKEMI